MSADKPFTSRVRSGAAPGHPGARLVWLSSDAGGLRAAVCPGDGGGLGSLQVRHEGRWHELLYHALNYAGPPPAGWPGRAPLLWPAVGCNYTQDQIAKAGATGRAPRSCAYLVDGRRRPVPVHGFAMRVPWTLDGHGAHETSAWTTCRLVDSPLSRKSYPFSFRLAATYVLTRNRLTVRYELEAGDNDGPMPFSIGNHIGLCLPFTGKGSFADCTVRTPGRRRLLLDSLVLLSGKSEPARFGKPVPMRDRPYDDNVVSGYTRRSAWAEVRDPSSFAVRVSQREVPRGGRRLSKDGDLLFVLYGDPAERFLCPEPWLGRPNSLNNGVGLLRLAPRKRFAWEMRLDFALS